MARYVAPPLGWGLIPLLAVAVVITLSLGTDKAPKLGEKSQPPEQADYYIRGARMSAMGPNGKPMYQVQAEEILHFPDNSVTLKDTTIHYQGGPAGVWQMQAGRGRIPPSGDRLELIGDVNIKGRRPGQGLTRMRMSEVVMLPKEGLMKTDTPVSIINIESRISAVGMEVDILKDVISLFNNVQVRYDW